MQLADPAMSIDLRWRDLPPPAAHGPDHPFESFLLADRREQFDLTQGPVVRLTIVRRVATNGNSAGDCPASRAVLTFHHALLDGGSLRLLIDEVSAEYAANLDGRAEPDPVRPQFGEFVRWWYATDPAASEQFWTTYLAGTVLPQPLPGYLGAAGAGSAEPRTVHVVLSLADSELVRTAASDACLSPSTMVSAAWALLRARYGGVSDIVVALTRSCRRGSIAGSENVIGMLINTVPLRVRIDQTWTVRELLTAVNASIRQIRAHQRTPMGSALTWAGLSPDTTLVDSLLMFDRHRLQAALPGGPGAPSAAKLDRLPSYPVTLCAYDEPQLYLSLICDGRRFADGAPERMLEQLRATLIELASEPAAPLADLRLDLAAEAEVLAGWNRSTVCYPADATIPALFAAQVARAPDAAALIVGGAEVSYAELDRRSSALAWQLRRRGVSTDMPVAVAIDRGPELIVALLAILKAGGAYLPIDADGPVGRSLAMIEAAGAGLMLVTAATAVPPELAGLELARMDAWPAGPAAECAAPPDDAHPLSLAYISFTSGSTGVPKGVAVPQRAVIRLISNPTFVSLGPGQRILQLAPVAFDAATLEIWGALLTGATLVIAPPGPLGLPELAALLRTADVTIAWLTTGLFNQLAEADLGALAQVPVIMTGGEVADPRAMRAVLAARLGKPLVHAYGPTENTTFTTCYLMTDADQAGSVVPIGSPIQHTTVHLLDAGGRQVPIGVPGELYTGGDGLARGYAGGAAATARVFVPDPAVPGQRLYRTGDLARWRADGVLEFVGRIDDQIKIRGFRIEPGEVAAVLRAHPAVREAVVVVAGEGAQRHLVGYVTPADGADRGALAPSPLRDYLAQRLPDYLVPAASARLTSFRSRPTARWTKPRCPRLSRRPAR